jgi:WD40 repeat protein
MRDFPHEGRVEGLSFSPGATKLAASSARWTTVWKIAGAEQLWTAAPGGQPVWQSDTQLWVSGFGNQPCLFDAGTGEMVAAGLFATDLALLPGRLALYAFMEKDPGGGVVLMNREGVELASEGDPSDRSGTRRPDGKLAASPDGSLLVIAERLWNESRLRAVDGQTLEQRWFRKEGVRSIALSPDGKSLALLLDDRQVALADAATGAEQKRIDGPAHAAAWMPDGTLLLGSGATLRRVDVHTGAETSPWTLAGVTGLDGIASLAVSADGGLIAAGLMNRLTLIDARA